MRFHDGYENVKVELISWAGNDLAKLVYEFGQLSHDYIESLPEKYDENDENCIKLINKIINGTTLPKFALMGTRVQFKISNISRICLAQLTRDSAIFASASTGVFPLTQDFNIPHSVYKESDIMSLVTQAEKLLEEAYIRCCEREIPTMESRYIGLHSQTISLTASYTYSDFVRSCHSRTSSNFCDECNLIYRLMYKELKENMSKLTDRNSIALYEWMLSEKSCINDSTYVRERLYNSDFTDLDVKLKTKALNDWRKSGWKYELERMYESGRGYLTEKEKRIIKEWIDREERGEELKSTYVNSESDVAVNAIKNTDYYGEYRC